MKLIPLFKCPVGQTADLIETLVVRPPQGGFTPDQVVAGARVLKAVREQRGGDTLLLEDADYKTVLEFLGRVQLVTGGEEMARMITDIREAKEAATSHAGG